MPLTKDEILKHVEHHGRFVQKRAAAQSLKPGDAPPRYSNDFSQLTDLPRSKVWRVNGKVKTWAREPERFKVPIKYGLYEHGYIDQDNCVLFDLE